MDSTSFPVRPQGIGNTPLVQLGDQQIWLKCEWFNLGGSSKARPAWAMLDKALQEGRLGHGQVQVSVTSGNTGLAQIVLARMLGIDTHLFMADTVSSARVALARYLGAAVTLTPGKLGSDGAYAAAQAFCATDPGRQVLVDQYTDDANWQSHYTSTGPEIWQQTQGRVTHLVSTVGTGGTITGTARFLRTRNPDLHVTAVEPAAGTRIPGLRRYHTGDCVPPIFDWSCVSEFCDVTPDEAWQHAHDAMRVSGLLLGPPSGAAIAAARRLSAPERCIVVIAPDSIDKYLDALPVPRSLTAGS